MAVTCKACSRTGQSHPSCQACATLKYKRLTVSALQEEAHAMAKERGWWEGEDPADKNGVAAKLALIHSEVSEALEELRGGKGPAFIYLKDGKPEGFPIELADAVIRIMDLCGAMGINLQSAIVHKMAYNKTRPRRHGGKVL